MKVGGENTWSGGLGYIKREKRCRLKKREKGRIATGCGGSSDCRNLVRWLAMGRINRHWGTE